MVLGVILFAFIIGIVTALICRKYEKLEKTELATYVVLIALGSLFVGLILSKCAR